LLLGPHHRAPQVPNAVGLYAVAQLVRGRQRGQDEGGVETSTDPLSYELYCKRMPRVHEVLQRVLTPVSPACVCARACVRVRACVSECMSACVRACVRVCVRSCVRACMHEYIHGYADADKKENIINKEPKKIRPHMRHIHKSSKQNLKIQNTKINAQPMKPQMRHIHKSSGSPQCMHPPVW